MDKHIATLEECAKSMRNLATIVRKHGTCSPGAIDHVADKMDAAIALMRGQSESSKKVEPAPNWCPTCDRRPNDPDALFCSNPFHLTPKDLAVISTAERREMAWTAARQTKDPADEQ